MKNFIFRSILPTFLTILLFVWAIFFFTLPALEKSVLDQKREMIRELTNSAWNILANFEHDERTGVMTREQAQKLAIESVRNLHYGQGMKDYFWINDMQPRMIIHPYRTDLNGKDLSAIEDSSGNRIFVKFVDLVKRSGAGYVEYLWQWKDDATRISPKLSYVKGFEPWGWIIGTGVYLNDVRQEIASIRNYLLVISTLILVLASALLAFLVAGSYQTEKQRERAEASLRASEEKYRLLVESAGEYMIMSLGGQKLFANCSMLGLLGYSAEEFARLDISQVVEMSVAEIEKGRSFPVAMMSGELSPIQYESYLIGKNGVRHHVMISLSSIPQGDMPGFLMIASELTSQQERVIRQDRLLEELQQSLLYFHQRVTDMDTLPAVICPETASLEEIGRHFENDAVTAVLIGNDAGSVKGVLMLSAFLRQLFTAGSAAPTTTLTGQLESAIIVDEDCLLFDVFLQYEKNGYRPVFFRNAAGELRMMNYRSFISLQRYSPTVALRQIQAAPDNDNLARSAGILPELARILINNKTAVSQVNRLITDFADMTMIRAIELAVSRLGRPPVEFCFLVLGSQGRREQTLCTDQDNAILYADPASGEEERAASYFMALGEEVCNLLNRCGYAYCEGKIMAMNPAWCQPLKKWQELFSGWITALEAEDLLQTKIFFDFRPVVTPSARSEGYAVLIDQLQQHLEAELAANPRFFFLLARNILQYEPPIGVFGNFIVENKRHKTDVLDIKSVMNLVVDFARIYALKHGLKERNTHERLKALREAGVFSDQSYYELKIALSYLMRIRLDKQAVSIDQGLSPDNFVSPDLLTSIDQKILKEIFVQIKNFQVRLSYDFTGMMSN